MKQLYCSLGFCISLLISCSLFAVEHEHLQGRCVRPCNCAFSSVFPLTAKTYNNCCIGCDKPGLGASNHNPSQNRISDCAFWCSPVAFVIDLISSPFRLCYPELFRRTRIDCSEIPAVSSDEKEVL